MKYKYKHYLYTTLWLKRRKAQLKEQLESIDNVLKERKQKEEK